MKVNIKMQSPYTDACIVTGQKCIINCNFHPLNTSIHSSLHTICRFKLRGLSFSHEHEVMILFRHREGWTQFQKLLIRGTELKTI
jgi:hypothetical protein